MRKLLQGILSLMLINLSCLSYGQRPPVKYGDIKAEDFSPTAYKVDSSAHGVVLFDVASSHYEGDNQGGFSVIFKRHSRIRLLNRNSFDLATVSIPMYASGSMEEKIESIEAATYILENGKVESHKLDKASIFKDKIDKEFTVRKFTLPNLKEGCIIEIKYTFKSPYERYLRPWYFQGEYPRLWSEYTVTVPGIYDFVMLKQGYHPYLISDAKSGTAHYNIIDPGEGASASSRSFNFTSTTVTNVWAMENVPALKKENYTTTLDNHVSKIEFQLSKIMYPNTPPKNVMSSWFTVSEELLKDPDFGEGFNKNNGWYKDELKKITDGAKTPMENARKIYTYVRDNYSCTEHQGKYLSGPIKKIYQSKSGSVADINLLLTSLLINQGLEAHPVLLSTRDHGKPLETYPIMKQFNYVISQVKIGDSSYLLDASENKLGFGKLTHDCYNGFARVIGQAPVLVDLTADKIAENKFTSMIIINDEGGGMKGSFSSTLGDYESQRLREKFTKTSKDEYFKELKKDFSFDIDISNGEIDSLKVYEEPVAVRYDFKINSNEEDRIYLNPVFGTGYKENPFKSAERYYPVEMPYAINDAFVLRMDIPKGYAVEELPKSARVNLNDNEGMYEYIIAKDDKMIQLRSVLKIKKANFLPDDYQTLRDFFAYVVKKHSEQIVLKKIK